MSTQSSMTTSRWNSLKQSINVYPPQDDDSFFWSLLQSLQPANSGNGNASYRYHSNAQSKPGDSADLQQIVPLLSMCRYNEIDLCELLMNQYQQSDLRLNDFISRCSLFRELETENISLQRMFVNYIQMYSNCIASPFECINLSHFEAFNDDIDIVLSYLLRINQCMHQYTNKSQRILFDIYFIPPTAPTSNKLDFVDTATIVRSEPSNRCNMRSMCGLDDVCSMFVNEIAKKMLSTDCAKKRYTLFIVRGNNENETTNDRLYLMQDTLRYDLNHNVFSHNDVLWHILSKQSTLRWPSSMRLNISDAFSVSYHLANDGECRMYSYYKGFGSRIMRDDIVNKWPMLFINGKNKISNEIKREITNYNGKHRFAFNAKINADSEYLFGLRYHRNRYGDTSRRILYFPKNVLKNDVPDIRELDDPKKQLYYYLSWTCKMQVIDAQFMEYSLNNQCGVADIAIFNSELHSKYSFDVLYVVSVLNKAGDASHTKADPKWRMNGMMTSHEIYSRFGIDYHDLPIGSRHIHNSFSGEINSHNVSLQFDSDYNHLIPVCNWKRVPCVQSQNYHDKRPNIKNIDLNKAIRESIRRIQNKKDILSLIPILTIDLHGNTIECDPLIPIKIPNKSSYIAVSYRVNDRNKAVVTNLYIDCDDIINKAALVSPYAYHAYQWIRGDQYIDELTPPSLCNFDSRPSLLNNESGDSHSCSGSIIQSATDSSWIIDNLQKALNDALQQQLHLHQRIQQKDDQINQMRRAFGIQIPPPNVSVQSIQVPSPNLYINQNCTIVTSPQTFPSLTSTGIATNSPQSFPLTNNNSNTLPQTPDYTHIYALCRSTTTT